MGVLPIPKIKATIYYKHLGEPLLKFYCEYCKDWHSHGGGSDTHILYGYRSAHCYVKTSPYLETGYELVEEGK